MAKPPKATPNSDIDGVHQDEILNAERAAELGESAEQLSRAHEESVGRPVYADDQKNRDDRSH